MEVRAHDHRRQAAQGRLHRNGPLRPRRGHQERTSSTKFAAGAVRAEGEIKPPRLVKEVAPVYPEVARQAGVQGVVILGVKTDEQGQVADTIVLRSIPLLDQAAIDAVRQWVYEPFVQDGKPVPVVFNVTVRFELQVRGRLLRVRRSRSRGLGSPRRSGACRGAWAFRRCPLPGGPSSAGSSPPARSDRRSSSAGTSGARGVDRRRRSWRGSRLRPLGGFGPVWQPDAMLS
ncbi:MAG: energy transducer TonB [Candidatus Moduliflexus flocculans]|nr:energy transducer TonB [Candidatus Moduliflexus flocculans]